MPYHRAARFDRERRALRTYTRLQETLYRADCDLSAYRVLLNQVSHVVVLGEVPPPELDRRIQRIVSDGAPTTLPPDVLRALAQRQEQMRRHGGWVEGHYRPGEPLDPHH